MSRLTDRFDDLKKNKKPAFISYIMAGDPDVETAQTIMCGLPGAGVDVIELGIPFTDPMADGPSIQKAAQRALAAKMTVAGVFEMVRAFRRQDDTTPIILMGYYNPIHAMGCDAFLRAAVAAGVDGLIIVDLPPEEDDELCLPAKAAGLHFIRLATPTTDDRRLPAVARNTSGFVYYVSVTGVTGAAEADAAHVGPEVARIRAATGLPVCVGFGVKTPERAAQIAQVADGVVVGSAIVDMIAHQARPDDVLQFVASLANAAHGAVG